MRLETRGIDLVAGVFAAALGLGGLRCLDVWFHLRTGQLIWETGSIPTVDTLSHTRAGEPWITHEWAFELPLYGVWQLGGDAAMVVTQALLAGLTFLLLTRVSLSAGAPRWAAFAASVAGAGVAASRFLARPHMASALFTVLLLGALWKHRRDARTPWALVPLFLLWANVHSGVVQGLAALAAFAGEEALRRRGPGPLARVLGASVLATLANPHGWRALWYPFWLVRSNDAGLFDIVELRPPDWPSPVHALAAFVVLAGLLGARRLGPAPLVLAAVGVALGVTRARASLDLALYGAPVLAVGLGQLGELLRLSRPFSWIPAAPASAAVVGALLAGTGWRPDLSVVPWAIPAGAMDYVGRVDLRGQMLNAHVFGGWLVWAHPERPVYLDGRNEVFVSLFRETADTALATLADRYDLGYAVLDYPSDRDVREVAIPVDINDVLVTDPQWALVYFDDVARVYARDRAENHSIVARDAYRFVRPGWTDFAYIEPYAADPSAAAAFEAEARRAIAAAPTATTPRMHLVELLRLSGRTDEALTEIQDIPAEDPFRLSRVGGLLLQAGRADDARDALRLASERLPDNAVVWSNLGLAELRRGDAAAALPALRRAVALQDGLLEARENLALALDRTGDAAGATTERKALAEVRSRRAAEHFAAGQQLLQAGYAQRAAVELERAAALAPSSTNTQYLLGVAWNVAGSPARAEAHLQRCLTLDAQHPFARLELGNAQAALARPDEARATLTDFLAQAPEARWRAVAERTLASLPSTHERGAP